jgi:hypothetical protein
VRRRRREARAAARRAHAAGLDARDPSAKRSADERRRMARAGARSALVPSGAEAERLRRAERLLAKRPHESAENVSAGGLVLPPGVRA